MALQRAETLVLNAYAAGWQPDPVLTVSEWADAHRQLGYTSPWPGGWRTARTPYLREIMDCLSATNPARRVVFMKGSRVGATEAITNAIGYAIHHSPGPILFVEPTGEDAKDESKTRLAPMFEDTDALRDLVADPKSRDSGNTILRKEFPGGLLRLVGANSKNAFRRVAVRYLFLDEVDAYPADVQGEGDPLFLAEQRASTFQRRKIFITSTPTIKGFSRIEKEFLASDRRRYFIPCPECGHMDFLTWEGRDWLGSDDEIHFRIEWDPGKPKSVRAVCPSCAAKIPERFKPQLFAAGEWRPTAESQGETLGYHLSALYSPLGMKGWAECAAEFLMAKQDPSKLKPWVNTVVGEPWEERGTSIEAKTLAARREAYPAEVPNGVGILVASVDTQDTWLEAQVKGYGAGEESWLIAHTQVHGDPGLDSTWLQLDEFLTQEFTHQSGRKLKAMCTAVDSSGHHADDVYKFCRARLGRRVFAIRGGNEHGKPLVPERPSNRNRYRAPVWTLCTDTAKDTIYSRLKVESSGPGYLHFPDWADDEYFEQLTAEKALRVYRKGRGSVRKWEPIRERNEALDLEVYCLAALYILGPGVVNSLAERAAALIKPPEEPSDGGAPPPQTPRARPPRGGWMEGWRG